VDNLGEYLRQQRKAKKLTIEELSQKTKISVAVLRDIENGKFDRYKGEEAYVKMYLKKITNVLNMDTESVTQQYLELTQAIKLEDLKEAKTDNHHNEDIVKKGKKFAFESPQYARKPSVYEDKSHVKIVRTIIILVLVCLVIMVIWYGVYMTRSQTPEPNFKPNNPTSVEGVDPNESKEEPKDPEQDQNKPVQKEISFTRTEKLHYTIKLPEDMKTFTFKIEYGNRSWGALKVNDQSYNDEEAGIYDHIYEKGDVIELSLTVADFNSLSLRNGYNIGHHYYINDQEIAIEKDDESSSVDTITFTLEKGSNESTE